MNLEEIQRKRREQQKQREAAIAADLQRRNAESLRSAVEETGAMSAKSAARTTTAVRDSTNTISEGLQNTTSKLADLLSSQNSSMSESLNQMLVATLMARDPQLIQVVKDFTLLLDGLAKTNENLKNNPLNDLPKINQQLVQALQDFTKQEASEPDYTAKFDAIESALKAIDFKPVVNMPKSDVKVDLKPVQSALADVKAAIEANKVQMPEINFDDVIAGLQAVQSTIANLTFPVPNYVLPFKTSDGKASQALVDSSGNLSVGGLSTPSAVLNGQKTVTTAGTRVALVASTTSCSAVIIRALDTNTGIIYVGNSSVSSSNGHRLLPGESVGLSINDLSSIYLDSSVNGEGVSYLGS